MTDLTVRYPGRPPAVDEVLVSIEPGEIVGVSGPSGCGKTTLALAIMGLLPPEVAISGSIRLGARELREMRDRDLDAIRGVEIGIVFQESALALNPLLTVGAQIAEVVLAHEKCTGETARERARAVMSDVGFGEERLRIFGAYPHELSGGQRQRVLIAQAIVCQPRLVIADEPVASLDAGAREDVLRLIRSVNERHGTSFLLITHSAEVLSTTADRVIEMEAGRVVNKPRHARRVGASHPAVTPRTDPAGPAAAMIQIVGLTKAYSRRRVLARSTPAVDALKGVDLLIERSSTLGLAGLSGCGKSTLARCLAGLEQADAGRILVDGTDVTSLRGRARWSHRHEIQLIFQDSAAALNPRFTAFDIVSEAMVIQGLSTAIERRARSAHLMEQVGLSPDRLHSRPGEFSGGERQRLAIARALAVDPTLLILDEAFSGLDAATRERIVQLLADLQAMRGLTYVCISHDLDLLAGFASHIAVMHDGRIVEHGRARAIAGGGPIRAGAARGPSTPRLIATGAVA